MQGPLHPDKLKSDVLSSACMLLVMRSFPRTLRIQNSSITATCQLLFFLQGQKKKGAKSYFSLSERPFPKFVIPEGQIFVYFNISRIQLYMGTALHQIEYSLCALVVLHLPYSENSNLENPDPGAGRCHRKIVNDLCI